MDLHVTFHPLDAALARRYASFTIDEDGGKQAAAYCQMQELAATDANRMLSLLPHYSGSSGASFDETHGFHVAAVQGYFDRYYYVHAGPLSALGGLIAPYTTTWQQIFGSDSAADEAANRLVAPHSSGVFIAADKVTRFMGDWHSQPELTAALARIFPGDKAHVLWDALKDAAESGRGLLEANGIVVPNSIDLGLSECYSTITNCDLAGLQLAIQDRPAPSAATPASASPPPPTGSPIVPASTPMPTPAKNEAQPAPASPSPVETTERAGAGGLAERLRAKRLDPSPAAETVEQSAPDFVAAETHAEFLDHGDAEPAAAREEGGLSLLEQLAATAPLPEPTPTFVPEVNPDDDEEPLSPLEQLAAIAPLPEPPSVVTALAELDPDNAPSLLEQLESTGPMPEPVPAMAVVPELDGDDEPLSPLAQLAAGPRHSMAQVEAGARPLGQIEATPVLAQLSSSPAPVAQIAAAPSPLAQLAAAPLAFAELEIASSADPESAGHWPMLAPEPERPRLSVVPDLEPEAGAEAEVPVDQFDEAKALADDEHGDDLAEQPELDTRLRLCAGGHTNDGGVAYFDSWDELWESITPLGGSDPIFLEIADMAGRWQPFSLIGTPAGTAIVRYRRSADEATLRVFGVHVDRLSQLDEATRNGVVLNWNDTESSHTTGSFAIPRTHLLPAHLARQSCESLIGANDWEPIYNDIGPATD